MTDGTEVTSGSARSGIIYLVSGSITEENSSPESDTEDSTNNNTDKTGGGSGCNAEFMGLAPLSLISLLIWRNKAVAA